MKNKDEKSKDLEALRRELADSPNLFVAGFEKLTVAQDFALRKTVKQAGGNYKVVKNNLAAKASEGTSSASVLDKLVGMTSVATTSGDPVALAKALTQYAKENPSFTFKAGFVQGRAIDVKQINELSSLPSKEEIYAKLLFLVQAPAQRLVTAVNGTGRNLAVVLNEAVKDSKFQG